MIFKFNLILKLLQPQGYAEYLSVFSVNAGKYGPEKLRIRTLFTQWTSFTPNNSLESFLTEIFNRFWKLEWFFAERLFMGTQIDYGEWWTSEKACYCRYCWLIHIIIIIMVILSWYQINSKENCWNSKATNKPY